MEGSCLRSYIDRKTTFVVNIRVRTLYVENKNSWLFLSTTMEISLVLISTHILLCVRLQTFEYTLQERGLNLEQGID